MTDDPIVRRLRHEGQPTRELCLVAAYAIEMGNERIEALCRDRGEIQALLSFASDERKLLLKEVRSLKKKLSKLEQKR